MPPEPLEPLAPGNASKKAQVVQLLEHVLELLDSMPDTAHLAAHVQGVIDELNGETNSL